MNNIFVDGFTRLGKDTYVDQVLRKDFPDHEVIGSNYDLEELSKKYSTDLEFFNLMILLNRVHFNRDKKDSIINRSSLGDLSYFILVHILTKFKQLPQIEKAEFHSYVDDFCSGRIDQNELIHRLNTMFMNKYDDYIKYSKQVIAISDSFNFDESDWFIFFNTPQYDYLEYKKNLLSEKAQKHYKFLIARLGCHIHDTSILHDDLTYCYCKFINYLFFRIYTAIADELGVNLTIK